MLSQSIVEFVRIDLILNNLKMTSTASVDRMVLFLELLQALVRDGAVALDFFSARGLDALVLVNDASGSGNVRRHSFELLCELTAQDNAAVAFAAYHAGYQIFQKDADAALRLLRSMNRRLEERRGGCEGMRGVGGELGSEDTLLNDVLSLRMLHPDDAAIQEQCEAFLYRNQGACQCTILSPV